MAAKLIMPKVAENMVEGLIVQWLKQEGDEVTEGEPILVIETDKASFEMEAPTSGILYRVLAEEGETVPVAELIAIIAEPGEQIPEEEIPERGRKEATRPTAILEEARHPPSDRRPRERVLATPAAKREARERGISLTTVKGSGPSGTITREDVLAAASLKKAVTRVPLSGARAAVARRMSESARTIPHFYISAEADMSEIVRFRASLPSEEILSYTAIMVKIVAEALRQHPLVNASFENDHIVMHDEVDVAVAVFARETLFAPVIYRADEKPLAEIATSLQKLIQKAQAAKLLAEDLAGGTFTLSNLGMFGVDIFAALINPPQSAVLALGQITERPVVSGGEVSIRPIMQMMISADHRVLDGVGVARFLESVKELIRQPAFMGT